MLQQTSAGQAETKLQPNLSAWQKGFCNWAALRGTENNIQMNMIKHKPDITEINNKAQKIGGANYPTVWSGVQYAYSNSIPIILIFEVSKTNLESLVRTRTDHGLLQDILLIKL